MDNPPVLMPPLRRSTDLNGRSVIGQPLSETNFVRSFRDGELTADEIMRRASLIYEAPERIRPEQDLAAAAIKAAAAMQRWELVDLAVDWLIAQQQVLVTWWIKTVQVRHGGDRSKGHVPGSCSQIEAEKRTRVKHQQVSRWHRSLAPDQIGAYRQRIIDKAHDEAALGTAKSHRALGTGDNEWFTPPLFIEAARDALGGEIDLDPATHPKAQKWIKAKEFYTRERNGLEQEWHGRVWLNPPYGRVEVALFIDKLIEHYQAGDVTAAILLTHNYTDTKWFHAAIASAEMLCFTRGRIEFEDSTGETCKPAQGQAFFYFGPEGARFVERFRPIGFVMSPVA